jgi:hypothetical protein
MRVMISVRRDAGVAADAFQGRLLPHKSLLAIRLQKMTKSKPANGSRSVARTTTFAGEHLRSALPTILIHLTPTSPRWAGPQRRVLFTASLHDEWSREQNYDVLRHL